MDKLNRANLNQNIEADIGTPLGPFNAVEIWNNTNNGHNLGMMTWEDIKSILKKNGRKYYLYPLQNAKKSDIVWYNDSANQPGFLPHQFNRNGLVITRFNWPAQN
jgi:hypothetical protein